MPIDLPAVSFQPSYPTVVDSVSVNRAGNRVVSIVEYADPTWQVPMRTSPLSARARLLVEAFRDACRGGLETVWYRPKHQCLPRSLWGNPASPLLANGSLSSKSGYQATVAAANGLTLSPGDLISLSTGVYHFMARVVTGGTVAGGTVALTLNMPVPSYIGIGATLRVKDPIMNTRMLPGSFSMTEDNRPIASFTLIEVPR